MRVCGKDSIPLFSICLPNGGYLTKKKIKNFEYQNLNQVIPYLIHYFLKSFEELEKNGWPLTTVN